MSKIIVDNIESTGTTVTVNDAIDAGTNAVTAGSITGLSASSLTTGTLPNAQLADGHILQVKYAKKTDTFSTTSTSYVDITDLSVSITPSSTSSKILISWDLATGQQNNASHCYVVIARDSTDSIFVADSAGSRTSGHGETMMLLLLTEGLVPLL